MRVNLLAREPRAMRACPRALRAAPAIALFVTALASAAAHAEAARLTWSLAQRDAARAALEMRAAPVLRLRREVDRLRDDVAQAGRLRSSGSSVERGLAELAARLPRRAWLVSLEIAGDGTLRLEGRATGFATVGSMLAEIGDIARFGKPALVDARRPTRTRILQFRIETRKRGSR